MPGRLEPVGAQARTREAGDRSRLGRSVLQRCPPLESCSKVHLGTVDALNRRRRLSFPLVKPGLLGRVARHAERLFVETDCLFVGPEVGGPLGGGSQGDPRLSGKSLAFGPLRRVCVRSEVVAGEAPGELVRAEALEEAGGGEVADLPVGAREGGIRDLADEGLDERVLAALR